MKKFIAMLLSLALVCTISVATSGCKKTEPTPPGNTEKDKHDTPAVDNKGKDGDMKGKDGDAKDAPPVTPPDGDKKN